MFDERYARKADAHADTRYWRLAAAEVHKLAPIKGRVLDFGCNTGRLLANFDSFLLTLFGVDVNKYALSMAKQRNQEATFVEYEKDELPRNIDFVSCVFTLPHLDNPEHVFGDIWGMLKPGGEVVVVTHNRHHAKLWWIPNLFNGYKTDTTVKKDYSASELKMFMRDSGFVCDKLYTIGSTMLPSILAPILVYVGHKLSE